jgi:hypothetical protein
LSDRFPDGVMDDFLVNIIVTVDDGVAETGAFGDFFSKFFKGSF